MNKEELKDLVKRYFNLTEITKSEETQKETFATAKLIDGTEVTNMLDSEFEEGNTLHVITAEGEHVIAPSGMHELESGIVVTVNEEGVITGIKRPGDEAEGSLEAAEEVKPEGVVEMAEEEIISEEVMEDMDVKEAIIEAIAEVVAPEIEAMKKKMAEMEEMVKDYMSKPADVPAKEKRFNKTKTINEAKVLKQSRYEKALNRITNK